jgi:hypothetical protein
VAQPKTDGTTCDDSLYCTQIDACSAGACIGSGDPCSDNGAFCDGVEYCDEGATSYVCSSTGDPCAGLSCDPAGELCTGSDVILSVENATGYAGHVDIGLDNAADLVSEVHLDVCDADNRTWLHISADNCTTTSRSSGFSCAATSIGGGCVRVDLTSGTTSIDVGSGAILRLEYTIDAGAPTSEIADVVPQNADVRDDTPASLTITPRSGTIRPAP